MLCDKVLLYMIVVYTVPFVYWFTDGKLEDGSKIFWFTVSNKQNFKTDDFLWYIYIMQTI